MLFNMFTIKINLIFELDENPFGSIGEKIL